MPDNSTTNKNPNIQSLKKDYPFRKIVTQHRKLRRYNKPVFDTVVYQINQFVKNKQKTSNKYQYDKALYLKSLILNNTASLLLSIPSDKPSVEMELSSFQQSLEGLLDLDLKNMGKGLRGRNIQSSQAGDIQCATYSPHFNLY